jgi:hypothetical protein
MASIHHHPNEGKANNNQMNWADPSEYFVGPVRGQLPACLSVHMLFAGTRSSSVAARSDSKKQQAKDKDREETRRVRLAPFQPTGPQSRRPKM